MTKDRDPEEIVGGVRRVLVAAARGRVTPRLGSPSSITSSR